MDNWSPNTFNNTTVSTAEAAATTTGAVAEAAAAATMIKSFRLFYDWVPHKSYVTCHLGKELALIFVPTLFRKSVNKPHSFFVNSWTVPCAVEVARKIFYPATSDPSTTISCFSDFNGVVGFGSPDTWCFPLLICLSSAYGKQLQSEEMPKFGHLMVLIVWIISFLQFKFSPSCGGGAILQHHNPPLPLVISINKHRQSFSFGNSLQWQYSCETAWAILDDKLCCVFQTEF